MLIHTSWLLPQSVRQLHIRQRELHTRQRLQYGISSGLWWWKCLKYRIKHEESASHYWKVSCLHCLSHQVWLWLGLPSLINVFSNNPDTNTCVGVFEAQFLFACSMLWKDLCILSRTFTFSLLCVIVKIVFFQWFLQWWQGC